MENHAERARQLSLFSVEPLAREEDPPVPIQLMHLPISQRHLLGADEMREMRFSGISDPDPMCGFRYRYWAFEYVARLYELAAYRWVLERILQYRESEIDLGLEELMPRIFEDFCSRLPIFLWDCWSEGTPHSHDKGLDGIIYGSRHGPPRAGIQVKYLSGRLLPGFVREFYGALATHEPPLSYGLLLTTAEGLPTERIRMEGVQVLVCPREAIQAILRITRIIGEWLPCYGDGVVRGYDPDAEEWKAMTARFYILRERIAEALGIPSDWQFQL